eukprot:527661_1
MFGRSLRFTSLFKLSNRCKFSTSLKSYNKSLSHSYLCKYTISMSSRGGSSGSSGSSSGRSSKSSGFADGGRAYDPDLAHELQNLDEYGARASRFALYRQDLDPATGAQFVNPVTVGLVGRAMGSLFGPAGALAGGVVGGMVGNHAAQNAYHHFIVITIGRRHFRIDFTKEGLEWKSLSDKEFEEECEESELLKKWDVDMNLEKVIQTFQCFRNQKYDLINFNCQHWCDEFVKRLNMDY